MNWQPIETAPKDREGPEGCIVIPISSLEHYKHAMERRDELQAENERLRQLNKDDAETDTACRELAKQFLPDEVVDGGSYGVPPLEDVVGLLVRQVNECRSELEQAMVDAERYLEHIECMQTEFHHCYIFIATKERIASVGLGLLDELLADTDKLIDAARAKEEKQ